jgi:hypothetical protein
MSYDASEGQQLDGTFPIYVHMVKTNVDAACFPNTYDIGSASRRFFTPELLSSQEPWFHDGLVYYNADFKVAANGVGSESGYGDDFGEVADYYPCLTGHGIEEPPITVTGPGPLDAGGNLHVKEFHGGVGRKTTIILQRVVTPAECGQGGTVPWLFVAVVIGWEAPGCRPKSWPPPVINASYVPGDTLVQTVQVVHNPFLEIAAYVPRLVVEWPSKDFVLDGTVDASDLGDFSAHFPVLHSNFSYGLCNGPAPNWKYDVVPGDEAVDASDLGAFAQALGDDCGMAPSKAGTEQDNERDAIMAWFGFALTGRMITISPTESVPEWELVDPVRNAVAILDPYGYRRTLAAAAAAPVSWSTVKVIYR